jgi:hypothetical protein
MPSGTNSAKSRLRDYLAARQPAAITESVWRDLLVHLAPVSESYLRDLLIATGLPFDAPYCGVAQHNLADLERSLVQMLAVYQASIAAGNRDQARYCRRQVIAAKDRARFQARSDKLSAEKRAQKEEMARWMLVWLENPEVFPTWVEARRQASPPPETS